MDDVIVDLKAGWKNAIQVALPSNVGIVADPFHVVRGANKRLDEERRGGYQRRSTLAVKG